MILGQETGPDFKYTAQRAAVSAAMPWIQAYGRPVLERELKARQAQVQFLTFLPLVGVGVFVALLWLTRPRVMIKARESA